MEVMIALSILVVSLVILVETQTTAAFMTLEADDIVTATGLAQEKMAEVRTFVEREGFSSDDQYEKGDFDDFGDDALNIQFEELERFHWEWLVHEVDLGLAGDLGSSMNGLAGAMGGPGSEGLPEGAGPDMSGIASMLSPDMINEAITPFIREVRVRVWWGDEQEKAEEDGTEVVLTTLVSNPRGNMFGASPTPTPQSGAAGRNNANAAEIGFGRGAAGARGQIGAIPGRATVGGARR